MTGHCQVPLKKNQRENHWDLKMFISTTSKLNPGCGLLDPHQPNLFHECCYYGSILQYIVGKTLNLIFLCGSSFLTLYKGKKQIMVFIFVYKSQCLEMEHFHMVTFRKHFIYLFFLQQQHILDETSLVNQSHPCRNNTEKCFQRQLFLASAFYLQLFCF